MPKLAANLTMLFNEVPFMERFDAAARAGFQGVEFLFPYAFHADQIADRLNYLQLDLVRYSVLVMLFLTMFTLPLKMVLRWTMNLKYFVDTPWIKF